MLETASVKVLEDVAMVSFHNCPDDIRFISGLFDRLSALGVNVDMISQTPSGGGSINISFTIAEKHLNEVLRISGFLKTDVKEMQSSVSSGNCKITIQDPAMKDTPGFASAVFRALCAVGTDLRLLSTSETEISLLIPHAEIGDTLEALKSEIQPSL